MYHVIYIILYQNLVPVNTSIFPKFDLTPLTPPTIVLVLFHQLSTPLNTPTVILQNLYFEGSAVFLLNMCFITLLAKYFSKKTRPKQDVFLEKFDHSIMGTQNSFELLQSYETFRHNFLYHFYIISKIA